MITSVTWHVTCKHGRQHKRHRSMLAATAGRFSFTVRSGYSQYEAKGRIVAHI